MVETNSRFSICWWSHKSKGNRLPLVRQLRLFLDSNGLLRCGGRIHNAPISELAKFPYCCYYQERHFEVGIHYLGLISPVTISTKLFLQKLWQQQLDWDTKLSEDLCVIWNNIFPECSPSYRTVISSAMWIPATHLWDNNTCFRWCKSSGIRSSSVHAVWNTSYYLLSKSREAPLKSLSLPRLELMAAVIASRLCSFVVSSLEITAPVCLWSDSQIVLLWIFSGLYKKSRSHGD